MLKRQLWIIRMSTSCFGRIKISSSTAVLNGNKQRAAALRAVRPRLCGSSPPAPTENSSGRSQGEEGNGKGEIVGVLLAAAA